ncbi:Dual specificity protein phosphatase 10 [Mortierella sp. AM989]|nr:Dual specificity protein phosphatase 10 [Mortierella sp. AM989]
MARPTSHSFSLQRPEIPEAKKKRNSKRLSLLVPPSPGKLEALAAATPTAITPSFPPTPSFSARRRFTSAPLFTSLSTIPSQSPTGTPAAEEHTVAVDTTSRRHSQLMLDDALPTPRIPLSTNQQSTRQRPISAYFADFSAECGTASPYTVEPVCILPHLYLGAEHNALDVNILSRLGITAVLNVAVEISTASQQQYQSEIKTGGDRIVKTIQGKSIQYKNLSWTHHQRNLQSEFPEAFAFIEETKSKGGKVLVHCQLGVSRSASLVIAYVMKSSQMNLTDAYDFVKTRSSVISPNMSLMYQLAEFGKSLNKPNKPIVTSASATPTTSRVTSSGNDAWVSSREDDEDEYPYPTELDLDENDNKTIITPPIVGANPPARSAAASKGSSLTLTRSSVDQSSSSSAAIATRPRSTYYRSPPVPLTLLAGSIDEPPKTPMVDQFSFPDMNLGAVPSAPMVGRFPSFSDRYRVPSTPMKDRFSFSDVPSTPTVGSMATRSRPRFPDGIALNSNNASSESFELAQPVPPFVVSHRPSFSTSSTSVSSFATSSSMGSRPSSTSSASSASISIYDAAGVSVIPPIGSESNLSWPKTPSTLTAPAHSQHAEAATTATKKIHTLAKALTRKWSSGFHGSQQQQQSQLPATQANGFECLILPDMAMEDVEFDTNIANDNSIEAEGHSTPEFIFSPRPCSPTVLETKTFGEFYQALRMEG